MDDTEELKTFTTEVHQSIEKWKTYPKDAILAGAHGTVSVSFDYGRDDRAHNLELVKSSGNKELDDAAMHMVAEATLPAKPCQIESVSRFTIVERYDLTD